MVIAINIETMSFEKFARGLSARSRCVEWAAHEQINYYNPVHSVRISDVLQWKVDTQHEILDRYMSCHNCFATKGVRVPTCGWHTQ